MTEYTPSAAALGFALLPAVAWVILFFRKPLLASAITFVVLSVVWVVMFAQLLQRPAYAQETAMPATAMPDLHHIIKIFDAWAFHSNFVAACFVGVVGIVAWMAIKITELHVKHPRYYDPRERPPLLERPRHEKEFRGKLPVVDSREI